MKWSYRIGGFRGIGVYLHVTFVLLVGLIGFSSVTQGNGLFAAAEAVLFVVALFGCVVLHEFGHALTAQQYGIPTRDITLLPIGGVARLERMPDDPRQELWVALAGPAVNVAIAAGLFVLLAVTGSWTPMAQFSMIDSPFLQRMLLVNVSLVIFNMLPAFPMDGGRVLRAVLAMRTDYVKATQVAAWAGQGMAVLFGVAGIFTNPMLIFIAMFVWMGAQQEVNAAMVRGNLTGVPVSSVMSRQFRSVSPDDSLEWAAWVVLSGAEREIPVIEHGYLLGFVDRPSLLRALRQLDPQTPVSEVMRPNIATVRFNDSLAGAFREMQRHRTLTAPVMDGNSLVGLIHLENLMDWANVRRHSFPRISVRRSTSPSAL